MESKDRRQLQSNTQGYPGQSGLSQQSPQLPATSVPDRFRPAGVQQSPTSAPSDRRGTGQQIGTYGYGDAQQYVGPTMQAGSLQYSQDYAQDPSRPQQQQQQQQQQQHSPYGQYGSGLMFNVSSQQQAPSPTSPYGPVQTFQQQQRQAPSIDVLPSQFGIQPQYYMPTGGAGPTTAAALATQNIHTQYSSISYAQQGQVGRPRTSLDSPYGSSLPDASTIQASSQQYSDQSYATNPVSETDAAYGQYQTELRKTNQSVRDGRLSEAGASLMNLTEWLLGNAEALNLVRDDETVYDDRLRLWDEFNNCWLVTLQKQIDMTREAIQTGQTPQQPQSLITIDALKNMGNELVRLSDTLEKHGLVDYQMGVWEETIIDLLVRCLDKMEEYGGTSTASNPGPTSTRRR